MTRAPEPTADERKTEEPALPEGWLEVRPGHLAHVDVDWGVPIDALRTRSDEKNNAEIRELESALAALMPTVLRCKARLALYRWEQERRAKLARDGGTT